MWAESYFLLLNSCGDPDRGIQAIRQWLDEGLQHLLAIFCVYLLASRQLKCSNSPEEFAAPTYSNRSLRYGQGGLSQITLGSSPSKFINKLLMQKKISLDVWHRQLIHIST